MSAAFNLRSAISASRRSQRCSYSVGSGRKHQIVTSEAGNVSERAGGLDGKIAYTDHSKSAPSLTFTTERSNQSYRSASIGSIRLARLAGISPAALDTATSTMVVIPAI